MKFTDGFWRIREGVNINTPVDIRDINITKSSLEIYAACKKVRHRGDTLNVPMITTEISSPRKDIIRIKSYHYKGLKKVYPEFCLNISEEVENKISKSDKEIRFSSGNLDAVIDKEDFSITFNFKDKRLTGAKSKSLAYIVDEDKSTYMRAQLDLGVGENVYGLGERFTPFLKNGQAINMWNEDGGTSSEIAYKNIPFYITNNGYGVFVNHSECVSFEVGSENVSRVQFSVPGECLDYFLIGGESLKEVLDNYTSLTGKPPLPPAWSFGLWLTTSFTTSYDENTVNSFIEGMKDRDLPVSVVHFDCFWMKEYQWCDFEWDKEVFPEPKEMLKRLKNKGLKICVWINPYIAQKSNLFDEGMEKGYLLKKLNGDVWQWDIWQAGMGLVDFTNPEASKWYKDKLKVLVEMGVDSFKTDFGERIPTDVIYYDGSDSIKMHNYYTYLYNQAVFEVLEENLGKENALLFARSATVGCQKFPVHWGGDCIASYESMAESLRAGLSLCLSGFAFWSHDISGFESTATPDLYKRWCAFGLLSSHSRLHGSETYRVPWLFDEESVDVLRFFTKLKARFMPYLYAKAVEASEKGIPLMRAMVLEFMNDAGCSYLDMQYMLGESLLVAPIFNSEGKVSYYLPEGKWTNFIDGKVVEGGRWHSQTFGYFEIPLMVRPSSIIPIGLNDESTEYDFASEVTFYIYELEDGKTVTSEVYNIDGQKEMDISVTKNGEHIYAVKSGIKKSYSIFLVGLSMVKKVQNGTCEIETNGIKILPDENSTSLDIFI